VRKIGFLMEEQRLRGLGWKVGVNVESVFASINPVFFYTGAANSDHRIDDVSR
jgi:hypothetical protein